MVCGALLTFATTAALFAAVLLAPALIVAAVERTPGRPATRAALFAGLAFTLGPLWRLWVGGLATGTALELVTDPMVLLPAWTAGACGWALCELLPAGILWLSRWRARSRAAELKAELAAIREEWDSG